MKVEKLKQKFGTDVNSAHEHLRSTLPEYPKKPTRPILAKDATSQDARTHADLLATYETAISTYETKMKEWRELDREVSDLMESYVKSLVNFDSLPETAKSKVWNKAWQDGHSSGWFCVYQELDELVDLFN